MSFDKMEYCGRKLQFHCVPVAISYSGEPLWDTQDVFIMLVVNLIIILSLPINSIYKEKEKKSVYVQFNQTAVGVPYNNHGFDCP
jgi:hypothetical protein